MLAKSMWEWCGRCGSRFRARSECEVCGPGDHYTKALEDARGLSIAGKAESEIRTFLEQHRRYHRRAIDYAMRMYQRDF